MKTTLFRLYYSLLSSFRIHFISATSISKKIVKFLGNFASANLYAFPCTPLKKLKNTDIFAKLLPEISMIFLVFLIFVSGIHNFYLKKFADNSHAAWFLNLHPDYNPKLFAKNSIVEITVSSENFFLPTARAENIEYLTGETPDYTEGENFLNNNGDLTKSNPDSVAGLIAKQIKVYETQSGDTLAKIAKENNISVETIKWANKLSSDSIKPGWFLVILPTDGILHKATSNDTLPDLAKKYNGDLARIISYNGKENAEDIDSEDLIIVPGGSMPKPPAPKVAANNTRSGTTRDGKVNAKGVVKPSQVYNGTGHIFPWGYCTWYVATKVHVPWGGNAKNWLANAKAMGYTVNRVPAAGSIVVTTDSRWGHVAYVESVSDDSIYVSEMNYAKFGSVNNRSIPLSSKTIRGYIHQ